MKTEVLRGKIRGKIEFLGDEKETWGVGRESFLPFCTCDNGLSFFLTILKRKIFLSPLQLTLHPYKQLNIPILSFLIFKFTHTFNQSYKPKNLKIKISNSRT
jgi:hypothetical protein